MNIFFTVFFMALITLNSYASNLSNTSTCKINECKLLPTMFIAPIERYRLNIRIDKSYQIADIYLNDDKFKTQTSKQGTFSDTIISRAAGDQCLRIKKMSLVKTFQFSLDTDQTVECMGKNNFCCRIIHD